jgi:ribonuclease HII
MLEFLHGYDQDEVQVGIDEAGRGSYAGPVVAAAVGWDINWLNENQHLYKEIGIIKDSKMLSAKQRKLCYDFIIRFSRDHSISFVSNIQIDEINILQATYKAMHDSLDTLHKSFDKILVDGNSFKSYVNKRDCIDGFIVPHVCVTNGDNTFFSIACASILAKVSRDEYIEDLCESNPIYQEHYDWKNNKCYGTRKHLEGIKTFGITHMHRKTFGICKGL